MLFNRFTPGYLAHALYCLWYTPFSGRKYTYKSGSRAYTHCGCNRLNCIAHYLEQARSRTSLCARAMFSRTLSRRAICWWLHVRQGSLSARATCPLVSAFKKTVSTRDNAGSACCANFLSVCVQAWDSSRVFQDSPARRNLYLSSSEWSYMCAELLSVQYILDESEVELSCHVIYSTPIPLYM